MHRKTVYITKETSLESIEKLGKNTDVVIKADAKEHQVKILPPVVLVLLQGTRAKLIRCLPRHIKRIRIVGDLSDEAAAKAIHRHVLVELENVAQEQIIALRVEKVCLRQTTSLATIHAIIQSSTIKNIYFDETFPNEMLNAALELLHATGNKFKVTVFTYSLKTFSIVSHFQRRFETAHVRLIQTTTSTQQTEQMAVLATENARLASLLANEQIKNSELENAVRELQKERAKVLTTSQSEIEELKKSSAAQQAAETKKFLEIIAGLQSSIDALQESVNSNFDAELNLREQNISLQKQLTDSKMELASVQASLELFRYGSTPALDNDVTQRLPSIDFESDGNSSQKLHEQLRLLIEELANEKESTSRLKILLEKEAAAKEALRQELSVKINLLVKRVTNLEAQIRSLVPLCAGLKSHHPAAAGKRPLNAELNARKRTATEVSSSIVDAPILFKSTTILTPGDPPAPQNKSQWRSGL